jgi:hypothetical protein
VSRVEPAFGTAARLFNERVPADDAPRPRDCELAVALVWGDTLIDLKPFPARRDVHVGPGPGVDFVVFAPAVRAELALIKQADRSATLAVPSTAKLLHRRGDNLRTLDALRREGLVEPDGAASGADLVDFAPGDRVLVQFGAVALIAWWTRRVRHVVGASALDWYFARTLSLSFMLHMALLGVVFMTDLTGTSLSESAVRIPLELVHSLLRPPNHPPRFFLKGSRAPAKEGRFGDPAATASASQRSAAGPRRNRTDKRSRDHEAVDRLLSSLFGGSFPMGGSDKDQRGLGGAIEKALEGIRAGDIATDDHGLRGLAGC